MAATGACRTCLYGRHNFDAISSPLRPRNRPQYGSFQFSGQLSHKRTFRTIRYSRNERNQKHEEPFGQRLGRAWNRTEIKWQPIPIGVGIAFLGLWQLWRITSRESVQEGDSDGEHSGRPPKRERIRPSGGWQVQVMSTLPLKALSRLWGQFNELTIPYYLRVPGFKLYGWIFGVNFAEVSEDDLHVYPNLASFFYRQLKPGVRPLDPNPRAILSPADGRVLQFGTVENGEVEQVKGMTYSLDALLGEAAPDTSSSSFSLSHISSEPENRRPPLTDDPDAKTLSIDQEFANVNGISYTLPNLFSGKSNSMTSNIPGSSIQDRSTTPRASSEAAVRAEIPAKSPWGSSLSSTSSALSPSKLFYIVVYLAPGDYHRFHSPVSWVCTTRRHFAGELYSVSPYLQRILPGLFTINERVVLMGRYKYGFFSFTAIGATNVGSIKINFDRELRTNSLTTDTQADRDAQMARERGEAYSGYSEASYTNASRLLGGFALQRGEEMGGFQLGSSIVLVLQAPAFIAQEDKVGKHGFRWCVEKGQKVKMGQPLGLVEEPDDIG